MGRRESISSDDSSSSDESSSYLPPTPKAKSQRKSSGGPHGRGGPAVYFKFEKRVSKLDQELRKLCNKARKLGSSAGILSASTRLRERLGRVLSLFRENATELYPDEIKAHIAKHPPPVKPVRRWKSGNFLDHAVQSQESVGKPMNLALEFRMFSKDVETLFECFTQFPQFVEELPDWSLADDLRVWAHSLDDFEHEFKTHAVQKYLYDSMADIGVRLETLTEQFIPTFSKLGIPTVRAAQDHETDNLQNQVVVAALFAGITVSMIQVWSSSDTSNNRMLDYAVSVLWYMALVFSISSTVNSLLGLSWLQAIYRSPDHRVPWWVLVWIKKFPLVFLVLSVACFFIALILFMFASQQDHATTTVTTVLSSGSCLGLVAMSAWFTAELRVFHRYGGRMWLSDAIANVRRKVVRTLAHWWHTFWQHGHSFINYKQGPSDMEKADSSPVNIGFRHDTFERRDSVSFWLAHDKNAMEASSKARHRWHEAVRRVITQERQRKGRFAPEKSSKFAHLTSVAVNSISFQTVPKLQSMTISQRHHVNEKHGALVRSVQFSPDGKYLISSSWDSTSMLLSVGSPVLCERVLTYPSGFGYVHQVEWSPDGKKLLIRSNRRLTLWHIDIDAHHKIRQVPLVFEHSPESEDRPLRHTLWHGSSSTFFSVQNNKVLTMDFNGNLLRSHVTENLVLRDICLTSDSKWMVCVGPYIQEDKRLHQKYGIIVWDLANHKVVKKIPVFYDMNKVTLACDDRSVLISYENKSPPQCWQLDVRKTGTDLILQHTYMPKDKTSFAALPSIFGGEYDHLVLRAASVGDIYIWDRDSAALIHCIKAPAILQGQLTSFAWNRGSKDYMFATGTHDGTVHIWSIPDPEEDDDVPDPGSPSTYTDATSDAALSDDMNPFFRRRFSVLRQATRGLDGVTLVSQDFEAGS